MAHTTEGQEFRDYLVSEGWDQLHADIATDAFERFFLHGGEDHLYENPDNLRVARGWIDEEREDYQKRTDNGCCGSMNVGLPCDAGTIMFGLNHGH